MAVILAIVLVVMLLMNGVMFYVLRTAAVVTRKQVDACFLRELESYGNYLDGKEAEGRKLAEKRENIREEIDNLEGVMVSLKTSPFYAPRPVPRDLFVPIARYVDDDFFENHKRVTEIMKDVDRKDLIRRIRAHTVYEGDREEYEALKGILETLDIETLYSLATLPRDSQIQILRETFQGRQGELFERWLEQNETEDFDCLDFVSWLREVRTNEDPLVYVRTGEKEEDFSGDVEEVVTVHDSNISEGIKCVFQNRLYDFSIYRMRSKK